MDPFQPKQTLPTKKQQTLPIISEKEVWKVDKKVHLGKRKKQKKQQRKLLQRERRANQNNDKKIKHESFFQEIEKTALSLAPVLESAVVKPIEQTVFHSPSSTLGKRSGEFIAPVPLSAVNSPIDTPLKKVKIEEPKQEGTDNTALYLALGAAALLLQSLVHY
jgi:hypothetical protein